MRWLPLLLGLALHAAAPAVAQQQGARLNLSGVNLERQAAAALGVLGLTAVPDGTAADLQIQRGGGESTGLLSGQLGSGFTWSEEFPIYLEGYLGYARYDPVFTHIPQLNR